MLKFTRLEFGHGSRVSTPLLRENINREKLDGRKLDLDMLMNAILPCSTLQRFAVVISQNWPVQLANVTLDWPGLIFACIISPAVDWSASQFQVSSDHPAFQLYFGPSTSGAEATVASVHFNQMVLFDTHIARMPI